MNPDSRKSIEDKLLSAIGKSFVFPTDDCPDLPYRHSGVEINFAYGEDVREVFDEIAEILLKREGWSETISEKAVYDGVARHPPFGEGRVPEHRVWNPFGSGTLLECGPLETGARSVGSGPPGVWVSAPPGVWVSGNPTLSEAWYLPADRFGWKRLFLAADRVPVSLVSARPGGESPGRAPF